jgi:hypothetical protein
MKKLQEEENLLASVEAAKFPICHDTSIGEHLSCRFVT